MNDIGCLRLWSTEKQDYQIICYITAYTSTLVTFDDCVSLELLELALRCFLLSLDSRSDSLSRLFTIITWLYCCSFPNFDIVAYDVMRFENNQITLKFDSRWVFESNEIQYMHNSLECRTTTKWHLCARWNVTELNSNSVWSVHIQIGCLFIQMNVPKHSNRIIKVLFKEFIF